MSNLKNPILVIVTGLPCTGKTYIGKRLADHLCFFYIHKDGIKECLFSSLGWSDREWSRRLGGASYDLMFYIAATQLDAGGSIILEANFYPALHTDRFRYLVAVHPCQIVQLHLVADIHILFERFVGRWESGVRHPGHVDPQSYNEIRNILESDIQSPLDLPGAYRKINTTNFEDIDLDELMDWFDHVICEVEE